MIYMQDPLNSLCFNKNFAARINATSKYFMQVGIKGATVFLVQASGTFPGPDSDIFAPDQPKFIFVIFRSICNM